MSGNGKRPSKNGRNGNGTFAKGNNGGPGNPWVKLTHRLKVALAEAGSKERIEDLADELWEMALADPDPDDKTQAAKRWAMQTVIERILGKPKQSIDVDVTHTFQQALAMLRPDRRDEQLVRN